MEVRRLYRRYAEIMPKVLCGILHYSQRGILLYLCRSLSFASIPVLIDVV